MKQVLCARLGIAASRMFHVSVAPCFDRKLEATRPQFVVHELDAFNAHSAADADADDTRPTREQSSSSEPVREVDLVLAATELLELLRDSDARWFDAPPHPADDLCAYHFSLQFSFHSFICL